jgi:predicted TIM-barrel fold metal-dependent hydrolase
MTVIDVDSHFLEPRDWLGTQDPACAAALPPRAYKDVMQEKLARTTYDALPESSRPGTFGELLPRGIATFFDDLGDDQPETRDTSRGDARYDMDTRVEYLDAQGIDIQFLNPTFLNREMVLARNTGRAEMIERVTRAWNSWATAEVADHNDRLVPVAQIIAADPHWSVGEMTRMRALGCRSFSFDRVPPSPTMSLSHPDLDPVWSAAEDLGMSLFLHTGVHQEVINPGWAANGSALSTMYLVEFLVLSESAPQTILAVMVIDGIFERHPKLNVFIEEMGVVWLPRIMTVLDRGAPTSGGASYRQPLLPSEYITRQVKVTPLAFDPIQPTIDLLPPEMIVFSSDFPHPEGGTDAVAVFGDMIAADSAESRENFFGRTSERILFGQELARAGR